MDYRQRLTNAAADVDRTIHSYMDMANRDRYTAWLHRKAAAQRPDYMQPKSAWQIAAEWMRDVKRAVL